MILKQHYLPALAHASYFIADEDAGVAAVVDPQRDVDEYLEDAKEAGVEIRHVLLTHLHADFVAGHLELQHRTGCDIRLGSAANTEYEMVPLRENEPLMLGAIRLEFLETPGHTPEGISILVYEPGSDAPHAVLTGDTLFIGDVGRPDLMASVGITPDELAGMLYDSLHGKLLTLPDATLVYPAHGAGSLCGKNMSTETVSTIGEQKQFNYALQPSTRDEFVEMLTRDLPDAPGYFSYDAQMNQRQRVTLDENLAQSLRPLSLDEVLCEQAAGAQVLDTRPVDDFAERYLRDSVNIALDGRYCTWAGTVLRPDEPIVLVTQPGTERESALRLGRIGFDKITGYLEGGIDVVPGQPEALDSSERCTPAQLHDEIDGESPPLLIDVRGSGELERGQIEPSLNLPLPHLLERLDEIPRDRPIVTYCAGGYRSVVAASLLRRAGFEDVRDLRGGFAAWRSDTQRAAKGM